MKAMVSRVYGSPDVLKLEDVPEPSPKDNEVLIKVHAASVNAFDWHMLRADPFFIRFMGSGFLRPKHIIPGADVAGRVEAVGRDVSRFKPGDEVFGDTVASGRGAFAEYVCVRENSLVVKPAGPSFEQAAAVPLAAVTALQALRDHGRIQAGQTVLINGASGGVGTFAVQLAKSFGAEVTAVCSTRNTHTARSIGACQVIDYTKTDFTKTGQRYDLVFAANGNRPMWAYKRALKDEGIFVLGGGSMAQFFQAALLGSLVFMTGKKKMQSFITRPNREDLEFLSELLEAGRVKPVIDRRYPLSEVPEAIRYLEKGHAQGKVVITVDQSG